MALTLDDYKCKIVNELLFATCQEEVIQFIDDIISELKNNKLNGHIIIRFVDKILSELDHFSPFSIESQQWSNCKMARISLNRIKNKLNETLN